ncbi:MAG TPA: DUF1902 domain-containing protein [Geminicoccaceae bacterium]|nr:DUF1902 domain-containing protein [Geminicoccaceae bacterium]
MAGTGAERRRGYLISALWDDEAKVWVAESDDVPGLVAEAATLEDLDQKLRVLVPELLELNAHLLPPQDGRTEVLYELTASKEVLLSRSSCS